MFFWGSIVTLVVGGAVGWWWGHTRARNTVNRQWMRALEEARTDGIIREKQRSEIIRIQGSLRRRNGGFMP